MIESLKKENEILKKKLDYLNNPENLKKELKEKFNLTQPGEQVIILPENF
ncbi:MAG: septum formation initiator family protein [Patescibacteria group bacterium]|nr:septum formation initiator family protein [Patescibacteria group bacterium]